MERGHQACFTWWFYHRNQYSCYVVRREEVKLNSQRRAERPRSLATVTANWVPRFPFALRSVHHGGDMDDARFRGVQLGAALRPVRDRDAPKGQARR